MRFAFFQKLLPLLHTFYFLKKIYLIKHYLGKDTEEEHLGGLYVILLFISKPR